MPFLSSRAMAMWMVLLVTPALFSLNMLISRLVAGWLPPVNLTFWRWFLTALFAGAIAGSQLAASLPVMRREWRRLLVLGAIGMSVCGLSAYKAGETTATAKKLVGDLGLTPVSSAAVIGNLWLPGAQHAEQMQGIEVMGAGLKNFREHALGHRPIATPISVERLLDADIRAAARRGQ